MIRTPSPATLLALAALAVALGGTGYAVSSLPRNSVGTTQLKTGAVTAAKIRDGAIADSDLAPALRARLTATGVPGPPGATGATGATGAAGPTASFSLYADPDTYTALSGGGTIVATKTWTLPGAGTLIINGKIQLRQQLDGGYTAYNCYPRVVQDSTWLGDGQYASGKLTSAGDLGLPLSTAVAIPRAGSYQVSVKCLAVGNNGLIPYFESLFLSGIWVG